MSMGSVAKEDDGKMYFRTRIPKELHREFKKFCIDVDRTMEDVAAELINDWVTLQKKRKD
jgi:hypothetical protein